jgi:tetratricopeptide (TPR) repeat protein
MKKIMLMAVAAMFAVSAGAQNPAVAKQIKGMKNYQEALGLLKSNLQSLSNEEKAAAYNKLVDLALDKFNKESSIEQVNQAMQKNDPYDKEGMNDAAYNAVVNAMECYKYDQMPNAKGQVKPKFAKNVDRVLGARLAMVQAGQDAASEDKGADEVLKYWGTFVDSDSNPLFANIDRTQQAQFMGQVARFAAIYAYQNKEMERASRYCKVAMQDPEERNDALSLSVLILQSELKTREDSVNYVNNLLELHEQNPQNEVILENIYNTYSYLGEQDKAKNFLKGVLDKDPNNFVALADMGIACMRDDNVDDAITYLRRAIAVKDDNAVLHTYVGACCVAKAQVEVVPENAKKFYEEAVQHYDRAKALDPNKEVSNWGYSRYSAYSQLYGPEDPRTKAAEAEQ